MMKDSIDIALTILQIAVIPLIVFLFRSHINRSKKIIDLERQITKQQRDAEHAELKSNIKENKISCDHKFEELSSIVSTNCKTMERFFERFDKTNSMVTEIWHFYKNDRKRENDGK